ncbi:MULTISPECIES: hypothetical protein [Prauserella salsuginis group]|uniref:MYXO-CTERM domain-containing protein n=2 Tax=Prauserella salsuginis group TaxID=2893672 RepID=A0A839XNK2_9PSEU|nr:MULTISPECIES: hypothetical protein [Prauserella salsuginis group]MBB3664321.1 hypothetical protein [Prauserella sediminis]
MVNESDDVAARLVAALRLRQPRVQVAIAGFLVVFMVVCVIATITRLSLLPLLPLLSFAGASAAAWRARTAADDRHAVAWTTVVAGGVALGFWLLGMINRVW